MKSGNNINKALKEALQNHPVPLNESQWERISGDLSKKKNRKPFFWLSLFSSLIVLLSVLFYTITDSNDNESSQSMAQNQSIQNSQNQSDNPSIQNSNTENPPSNQLSENQNNDLKNEKHQPLFTESSTPDSKISASPMQTMNGKPKENISIGPKTDIPKIDKSNQIQAGGQSNPVSKQSEPFNTNLLDGELKLQDVLNQYVMNYLLLAPQYVAPYEMPREEESFDWLADVSVNQNKTSKSDKKNNKKLDPIDTNKNKWAIGLQFGTSVVNSKSSIGSQNSLHRDTRSVFDNASKNQTSNFLKVTLDIPLTKKFNLGLNSGVQFRQVVQNAEYNYFLDSIPFRDVDNTILFYLENKDSANASFNGTYKNVYQYVNIPLNFTYRLPLNNKNEFLIGAGMQLNLVLKNKGKLFDLNDQRFKDNSEFLKTTSNLSWMGSLEYSRSLYDNWWLGLGMGIQNQNLKFASENGYINNVIKFNSFHLHLRYKL